MAKILYAWEMGGGLGHLSIGARLAHEIVQSGHELAFAIPNQQGAAQFLSELGFELIFKGPAWHPRKAQRPPVSLAEIFLNVGYADPKQLREHVQKWLDLIGSYAPDVIIVDFAPTAALVAMALGIPYCFIGHGFFIPPLSYPIAPFDRTARFERVSSTETALCACINHALAELGLPLLPTLATLFERGHQILTTWPEIDHYPGRTNARFHGPIRPFVEGCSPKRRWSDQGHKKVFVYLYGTHPLTEVTLRAIADSDVHCYAYVSGASKTGILSAFHTHNIEVSATPYQIDQVLPMVDAVVCHGNFGTMWESLLAGKPVLCLPAHREQHIASVQVVKTGAAIMADVRVSPESLKKAVHEILYNERYSQAAQKIQRKYFNHDFESSLKLVVSQILRLAK